MRKSRVVLACVMGAVWLVARQDVQAQAQDTQAIRQEIAQLRKDLEALQKQYGDRLAALEARLKESSDAAVSAVALAEAAQQPTAPVPAAQGAGGPSGTLPVYGGTATSKIFNPDIAVIGNFLGAAGHNSVNPAPSLSMQESEASFQAIVDPYARADFFLAFGEEGVELEEGFLTFPAIPGGFLTRVGKMKASFGRVNTLHSHAISWTDRPLVQTNLMGGDEGIADAGFSVARLVPNPWIFLEATGEVYRGDAGDLFTSSQRGDLSYLGHLRGYHDVTESTNIELGASYSRGHNSSGVVDGVDVGRFVTQLWGMDATIRWRPLQRAIYRSFVGRSELVWSRREQPDSREHAFGYFVSGDYQFARRWTAGGRYDRSDRADEASLFDTGQSLLLTFRPSEFSQLRGQYRRTNYAVGDTANEFLFQFLFSIGAHGAHPF